MSFFPYAVVSASSGGADDESADQSSASDNSIHGNSSQVFSSRVSPSFSSSSVHQSWGSSGIHSSLTSRQYAAGVDISADTPVPSRHAAAGPEGSWSKRHGIDGGKWEDAAAGLCPPSLPRDVQIVGSSSVRSVSSSNSGHDDPGSSSMLFYPNTGAPFGSTQCSFISGASDMDLSRREDVTDEATQGRGGQGDRRIVGKGQLRSRGPATGYDPDVYFLAEDEEDGVFTGDDGIKHQGYMRSSHATSPFLPGASSVTTSSPMRVPANDPPFAASSLSSSSLYVSLTPPVTSSATSAYSSSRFRQTHDGFSVTNPPSASWNEAATGSGTATLAAIGRAGASRRSRLPSVSSSGAFAEKASVAHEGHFSEFDPHIPPAAPASTSSDDLSDWYTSWEHPFSKRSPLDVSRGPVPNRKCTDLFFFCLFLVAWVGVGIALVVRLLPGPSPIMRLTAGIDWKGRVCGYDEEVRDYPFVYWPAKQQPATPLDVELSACSIVPVCTKKCPVYFSSVREKGACSPDAEAAGLCTWYGGAPTASLLRRYCLFVTPDGKAKDHGLLSSWIRWIGDLDLVWMLVIVVPVAALLLGYFFMWLLQKAAHMMVAGIVMLLELLLIGCSYEFYRAYSSSSSKSKLSSFHTSSFASPSSSSYVHFADPLHHLDVALGPYSSRDSRSSSDFSRPASIPFSLGEGEIPSDAAFIAVPPTVAFSMLGATGSLALGILCSLCAISIAVCAVIFRRELQMSTSVLTAAAMLLQQAPVKFLLLLPLAAASALATHSALLLTAVSHILALGPISTLPLSTCIPALSPWLRLPVIPWSSTVLLIALLFLALWTGGLLNALCRMIIAYYSSAWYFMPRHMPDRRELLKIKAGEAARVVFSYHLGSAALGGLILSTVQLLKCLLGWAKYRSVRRNHSIAKRVFFRLCNCIACLYTPVKYITPTAFVFVALLGQPLLQASCTAVATLTRNPVATAFVWQVGWLLQTVGQLSISIFIAWCTYTFLPMIPSLSGQLSSLAAPVIFSFVVSLYVANVAMQIFGYAADTILQAFLADREMSLQDGKFTAEHAPPPLRVLDRYMLRHRRPSRS